MNLLRVLAVNCHPQGDILCTDISQRNVEEFKFMKTCHFT